MLEGQLSILQMPPAAARSRLAAALMLTAALPAYAPKPECQNARTRIVTAFPTFWPSHSPDDASALLAPTVYAIEHRLQASAGTAVGRGPCLSRCLGLLLSHSSLLCYRVLLDCPRIAARFPPCGSLCPISSGSHLSLPGCTKPASARHHR